MMLKELQQRSRELKAAMTEERKAELRRWQGQMMNYLLLSLMMAALIAMGAHGLATEAGKPWIAWIVWCGLAYGVWQPFNFWLGCSLSLWLGEGERQ